MHLTLTEDEARLVSNALHIYTDELQHEILRTDDRAYRSDLSRRHETLQAILERVDRSVAEVTGLNS